MPTRRPSVEPTRIILDEASCLDGPPRLADAAAHRRFAIDEDAARFFGWTTEQARSKADSHYEEVIRTFVRDWPQGTRFNFTIRRRRDGRTVGSVELRVADRNVSYVVAAGERGKGLATRAVDALLRWAALELPLDRVKLKCHVENGASRRVAEKCGFMFVARDGEELRFVRAIERAIEILDPDPHDARLADVAETPAVWAAGDVLTIAVRGQEKAPYLIGTARGRARPCVPAGHRRAVLRRAYDLRGRIGAAMGRRAARTFAATRLRRLQRRGLGRCSGSNAPRKFAAVLAFSLAVEPSQPATIPPPAHALVAGQLEPPFHRVTTSYARKLRRHSVRVPLRTPVRGHDHTVWSDEFLPALRCALESGCQVS